MSFRLESPVHAPKIRVFGEFYPQNLGAHHSDPQKRTSLRDFMSNELLRVKIHQPVWPVRESQKKRYKKGTKTLYLTYMPRSPQWMDLYQIWFRVSSRGRNQLRRILLQSAHGFRFCEGSKFAISHWLGRSPLTQCWRYRAACDSSNMYRSWVIWCWIISWPWNLALRSLKVIEIGAIRKIGCCFLFAFHSNYGDILYRLRDIATYW